MRQAEALALKIAKQTLGAASRGKRGYKDPNTAFGAIVPICWAGRSIATNGERGKLLFF